MKIFIRSIGKEKDYYYRSNFKDRRKKEEELRYEILFWVLF
jgi:hypothetical protein